MLQHRAEVEAELLLHLALLVRILDLLEGQAGNLCDALDCIDTRLRRLDELADEALDQPVAEDVDVGDPGEERLQRP